MIKTGTTVFEPISVVQRCFCVFNAAPRGLPRDCDMHLFPRWQMPIMSPLFFRKNRIQPEALGTIERFFEKLPRNHPYDAKAPYFNLVFPVKKSLASTIRLARQHGWKKVDRNNHFCLLTQLRPFRLPVGFTVKIGNYFDKSMSKLNRRVTLSAFPALNSKTMNEIQLAVREIENPTGIVIFNSKNQAVASGAVFSKGEFGYLFSGGVIPRYRKLGLWNALISIRQQVSYANGARFWLYTSDNEIIKHRGDHVFKNVIFEKAPTT